MGSVEHESPITSKKPRRGAIKDAIKTGVALGVLAILLVGIEGSTRTTNQLTGHHALQAKDTLTPFISAVEAHLGQKETIIKWNDTSNGTNAMRFNGLWTTARICEISRKTLQVAAAISCYGSIYT